MQSNKKKPDNIEAVTTNENPVETLHPRETASVTPTRTLTV
jgi:hypothetical protein